MSFEIDYNNDSYDVFRIRYALDTDMAEKRLKKFDKDVQKDFKNKIEKETNKIRFRTLQYVEDFLGSIEECFDQRIEKLKKEDPIVYYQLLDEQKATMKTMMKKTEEKNVDLLQKITEEIDENKDYDFRLVFLLTQVSEQFSKSYKSILDSLAIERITRKKTQMSKVIKCFTASFLVFLRLIEIGRHWEKADKEKKKQIEDLILWDLDTFNKETENLPKFKRRKQETKISDEELISALWG